jgi:hypothetical protein
MATTAPARARARIPGRTLRRDRWWGEPAFTAAVLLLFVVYSTWAAFQGTNYYAAPYLSPFYSPCVADSCVPGSAHLPFVVDFWTLSPALIILPIPLGFRLTCYYYRKAYYRSVWLSPPACGVREPHRAYGGESRFPLILQNVHRYFLYLAVPFNLLLTWDAVVAFQDPAGDWGHVGLGTLVLLVNAALLWLYTLSCHSCRHIVGGRLNNFARHPVRYRVWTLVSQLNVRHMQLAWASLVFVALTDLYVRLIASGVIADLRFF